MNLKEQILLRIDEKVEASPIKKIKKSKKIKKKDVVETVKLRSLLQDLLLEAMDLDSGSVILRALERGQIPGVKKKEFLSGDTSDAETILDNLVNTFKSRLEEKDLNKNLLLFIKRVSSLESLKKLKDDEINQSIDVMSAFFGNRNKKEVKQEEETKKRFEKFENSTIDLTKDKEFEQWANDKFAHKAKAKDEDIEVIYDDGEWSVSIPKTFAAASKLACMGNKKTKWCTAANKNMFDSYSSGGNNLFVIRNEKKGILFQMDWGRNGNANFMDEKDLAVSSDDLISHKIPNDLFKSIKNKDGDSVFEKLGGILDNEYDLEDTSKTPEDKLDGWKEVVFNNISEFINEVEDKEVPRIFANKSMWEVLNSKEGGEKASRIVKYEKEGNNYYHIIPKSGSFSFKSKMYNLILKDEGSSLRYVTTDEAVKSDLPVFLSDRPLQKTEKTSGDMDGWDEHVFTSVGNFLREISKYEMPKILGSADSFTRVLKEEEKLMQLGRVSKGRKIYYYIIANEGHTIKLNSKNVRGIDTSKRFERIALEVSGNKLTMKTAKSIGQSNLPDVFKEKLFTETKTSYNSTVGGIVSRLGSIKSDQFAKSAKGGDPVLHMVHGIKVYENVNSFNKVLSIPDIPNSAIERVKSGIIAKRFNPSDIVAVVNHGKTFSFVAKNFNAYIYDEKDLSSSGGVFVLGFGRRHSNAAKWIPRVISHDYLYEKFFKKKFSEMEREVFENLKDGKGLLYDLGDGASVVMDSSYSYPIIAFDNGSYYRFVEGRSAEKNELQWKGGPHLESDKDRIDQIEKTNDVLKIFSTVRKFIY